MHDDHLIDGSRPIAVTAQVDNWTSVAATMTDVDADGTLAVGLPASGWERQTLIGAGTLTLGGALAAPLVVSLASSDTTELSVPATVTIPAGQTTATFTVALLDNGRRTGPLSETVTATAGGTPDGLFSGSATMVVDDGDVDHYGFAVIGSPEAADTPFAVTATAYDVLGNPVLTYYGAAALTATGQSGPLGISPTSVNFASGVWTGTVTIGAVDPAVTLQLSDGSGRAATSNTFTVKPQVEVAATTPAPNGVFSLPGPLGYNVNFSEPVAPSSVTAGSLLLSGIPGATVTGVTLSNGDTTAVYTLNLPVPGTLAASIAAGAVTDQYGLPNAAFSASYTVNVGTMAFPLPLAAFAPAGSLIYSGSGAGTDRAGRRYERLHDQPGRRRNAHGLGAAGKRAATDGGGVRSERCIAGQCRVERRRRRRPAPNRDGCHGRPLHRHRRGGRLDHRGLHALALPEHGVGAGCVRRCNGQHFRHGPGPHRLVRAPRHAGPGRRRGGPRDGGRRRRTRILLVHRGGRRHRHARPDRPCGRDLEPGTVRQQRHPPGHRRRRSDQPCRRHQRFHHLRRRHLLRLRHRHERRRIQSAGVPRRGFRRAAKRLARRRPEHRWPTGGARRDCPRRHAAHSQFHVGRLVEQRRRPYGFELQLYCRPIYRQRRTVSVPQLLRFRPDGGEPTDRRGGARHL